MTSNNNFNSRLSQLQTFEKSQDYSNIVNKLTDDFDSDTNDIIRKWRSKETLSNVENKYIDLYSNVQLSFVKYSIFNSNTIANVQTIIDKFRVRLFQRTQTKALVEAVEFIREQQPNSNNGANEDDLILVYIMRMIDARSLAYRLYFKELASPPTMLNNELKDCLFHRHAKNYLYEVKSIKTINQNISIDDRHKFFIGCCTFAVALYENNKDLLKDDEHNNKYICLLAKYVRIMLSKTNFEENESILYCIRGILALLTNCVPTEHWLIIINEALLNENNEDAQKKNPFNLDLFSLIINKLLASKTLQKKTKKSGSNDETLLLDTVLVFLVKWSDTQSDPNDEDEEDKNDNNYLSPFDQPNQLLNCFCSHEQFQNTAQIIIPYIDAKYDRLRLMALSILSNIMNYQDFEKLKNQKPHMAKDLVKLIFDFINEAAKQPDHKYKGISFDKLLRYLLRFLVQDFVKQETLSYISQIVDYAKHHNLYALKILRKISTSPEAKKDLLKNTDLKQFLDTDADNIYGRGVNETMYKVVKDIRQNLAPPPSTPTEQLPPNNDNQCQAFISYCHKDKDICKTIQEDLEELKVFTKIWVDKRYMRDDMFETVATAIGQSKIVFVLLSDAYCLSDFCRREYRFAWKRKIKIYVIIVEKDFNMKKYDWVEFSFGTERYYKMHVTDDFPQLIGNLSEFLNKKIEDEAKRKKNTNEAKPSSLSLQSSSIVSTGDRVYSRISIAAWTSDHVQNWCFDNQLENWSKPLTNFDGQSLLRLHQHLLNDSNIQYILKGNTLNGFDVVRFQREFDKILPKTTSKNKPPTKKHVPRRRTSKSSNK